MNKPRLLRSSARYSRTEEAYVQCGPGDHKGCKPTSHWFFGETKAISFRSPPLRGERCARCDAMTKLSTKGESFTRRDFGFGEMITRADDKMNSGARFPSSPPFSRREKGFKTSPLWGWG